MEKSIWQLPFSVLYHYIRYTKNQYLSAEQIRNWQLQRLRDLLKHCQVHVPYYQALFKAIGLTEPERITWKDWEHIPLLDKETVRRNPELFMADNAQKYGITKDSTSGSTGSPLHFLLSDSAQANKIAALLRSFHWAGYRLFMPTLNVQSYYFKEHDFQFNPFYRSLRFDSNRLSQSSCLKLGKELQKRKPGIILGFPFDIVRIGQFLKEENRPMPRPKAVITYGETLSERRRVLISEFYQAPVFDFYSMHEGSAMISQCEKGGTHLIDDFAYMEILDRKQEHDINTGNLAGTNFYNYTMPFIRYRIRDIVEPEDKQCTCGRSFRLVKRVLGKQCDYIKTDDGRLLGAVMSHSIDQARGVIMSQCIQESSDYLVVNVVTDHQYNEESEKNLEAGFRKRIGERMRIEIRVVTQLEKTASGKTPFIISRIGNQFE